MQNDTLKNALVSLGLSENQASIYLTLLGLTSASVYKVSTVSGMPRSTCYEILNSLVKIGLASKFSKKQVIHFSAESPQILQALQKQKLALAEETLPQLVALYGEREVIPKVRFFEGKAAVWNILNEFLNEATTQIAFSSTEEIDVLGKEFSEYITERIKRKIATRVIMNKTPLALELQKKGQSQLREVRIAPESFTHHNLIIIWNNKVAVFTFKDRYTVLVTESSSLAEFYKTTFEHIWRQLPKPLL